MRGIVLFTKNDSIEREINAFCSHIGVLQDGCQIYLIKVQMYLIQV